MSFFVDFDVKFPPVESQIQVLTLTWCKVESILAVSTDDGVIRFFQEEGAFMEEVTYRRRRGVQARYLDWRTRSKVLACGWDDGMISLWSLNDQTAREDGSLHAGKEVCVLEWTPEGTRLLTCDVHGRVGLWKTDHRSRLTLVLSYGLEQAHFGYQLGALNLSEGQPYRVTSVAWAATEEYRERQKDLPSPPRLVFLGTRTGHVLTLSTSQSSIQFLQLGSPAAPIIKLFWVEEAPGNGSDFLIAVSTKGLFYYHKVELTTATPKLTKVTQLNLSWSAKAMERVQSNMSCFYGFWISSLGVLCTFITGESEIKVLDVSSSYAFSIRPSKRELQGAEDSLHCLAYNPVMHQLSAGTAGGAILLWKAVRNPAPAADFSEKRLSPQQWSLYACAGSSLNKQSCMLEFGHSSQKALLASVHQEIGNPSFSVRIYYEAQLLRDLYHDTAAIQLSSRKVLVYRGASIQLLVNTKIRVKGLMVTDRSLLVWNHCCCEVYDFTEKQAVLYASFDSFSASMAIVGSTIYQLKAQNLEICTKEGTIRSKNSFNEKQGLPVLLACTADHLAVCTKKGYLAVYSISNPANTKLISPGIYVDTTAQYFHAAAQAALYTSFISSKTPTSMKLAARFRLSVRAMKLNQDGTKVGFLCDVFNNTEFLSGAFAVFVYDVLHQAVHWYDFKDQGVPVSVLWDSWEPRLFATEVKRRTSHGEEQVTVDTFFSSPKGVTGSAGATSSPIVLQDSFALGSNVRALLGLKVPKLFFVAQHEEGKPATEEKTAERLPALKACTMREFSGLERTAALNDTTRKALVEFSYCMSCENIDGAYTAIRCLEDASIWETLSILCLKKRRVDLLQRCLTNAGNHRAALFLSNQDVSQVRSEKETLALLGSVAEQLGLFEETVNLFKEAERSDLLNKFYQGRGMFDKALSVAEKDDRLHLKHTHFLYAKHLEATENYDQAMTQYELANTQAVEVPRMLFHGNRLDLLEKYVRQNLAHHSSKASLELVRWCGTLFESLNLHEKAIQLYKQSQDYISLIRVYCHRDELKNACAVILNKHIQDPHVLNHANFLIAKKLEEKGRYEEAFTHFTRAGGYCNAIRLAKSLQRYDDVFQLATRTTKAMKQGTARYLLKKGFPEKAARLYEQLGRYLTALKICFRAQLFDLLSTMIEKAGERGFEKLILGGDKTSSGQIIADCAQFFLQHGQYEKATNLYLASGNYHEALRLCEEKKVTLTDEKADQMTPSKDCDGEWNQFLRRIARVCEGQKSYHLATKKYTQAGDKVAAIKALLKSGDTKKIIYFSKQAKQKEVYVLAANHLQNLDWRADPVILKAIVFNYTKAKEYGKLSQFYHSCAHDEIISYKDYERALEALAEALTYMEKACEQVRDDSLATGPDNTRRFEVLSELKHRHAIVKKIVLAKCFLEQGARLEEMEASLLEIIDTLTTQPKTATFVPIGDIYGELVLFYAEKKEDYEQAYEMLKRMRGAGLLFGKHLEDEVVHRVCKRLGASMFPREAFYGTKEISEEGEEEVYDEVEETIYT